MTLPIGTVYVSATTNRATVGRFNGNLVNGLLLLQVQTLNPSVIQGLAFGIFSFIDDDSNIRTLGDTRYYPKAEPTTIALGYGNRSTASGVVIFEPRAYNLAWIKRTGDGAFWGLNVETENTGASTPGFTPSGFADGALGLIATAITAASGAQLAQVNWHD